MKHVWIRDTYAVPRFRNIRGGGDSPLPASYQSCRTWVLDSDCWTVDLDSGGKDSDLDLDSSSRDARSLCKCSTSSAKFLCFVFSLHQFCAEGLYKIFGISRSTTFNFRSCNKGKYPRLSMLAMELPSVAPASFPVEKCLGNSMSTRPISLLHFYRKALSILQNMSETVSW